MDARRAPLPRFATGREAALSLRPDHPVYCFRPAVLAADAAAFLRAFPGKTAYAAKANPEPMVLKALAAAGVAAFDVASPAECAQVRAAVPGAELLYMHPVKAAADLRLALERDRVRVTVVDHEGELEKLPPLLKTLGIAPGEMTVLVRIATPGKAARELSRKFGASPTRAARLLRRVDGFGLKAGLCFHVGSQVADAGAYERAVVRVAEVRAAAGVPLHGLDVGGGFPVPYGEDRRRKTAPPPSLDVILLRLAAALTRHGLDDVPLVAEPGRVIVARAFSVIARVLLRKGRRLYLNDGVWASLSDAWTSRIILPVRHIAGSPGRQRRQGAERRAEPVPFRIFGATCDSRDVLPQPFHLPEDVATGDWIEIGHIGAYSLSLRTRFNGFYPDTFVEVEEPFEAGDAPQGFGAPGHRAGPEE